MIFSIFVVVLLIWIIQRLWKKRRIFILSRKLKNKYIAWPILGHALMFLGSGEDRMNTFQKFGREALKSESGLTGLWLGPQYFAVICDPVIAGVVSKVSLGKTHIIKIARHLLGNGTLFAPVHIWRPRRKILTPIFSPKNLNGFIDILVDQSNIMTSCFEPSVGKGSFSIWNNMTSYTMNSVCKTALGIGFSVQTQDGHPFAATFAEYFKLIAARVVKPWLHWDFLYKLLPVYQELEQKRKIIHDTVDDIIRKNKILLQNENIHTDCSILNDNNAQVTSFMDFLLKPSGGADRFTDVELREELLVLLLAGTDTSAVGACFTIVMLSRNSKVQEKAYEEVREIFGDSQRPVNLDDLSKLKYIDAVIRETLRLYPPVPIIIRENDKDVELSSEITLPAGSCACINIWGLHRNPRYWGADAEEFNPDRLLNGSVTPAAAFMSFSYGPRNCLGYKYAMMSLKVAVTTLLRHYRVLPPSDLSAEDLRKPLRLSFDIMMKDVDDFKVRLEHRN